MRNYKNKIYFSFIIFILSLLTSCYLINNIHYEEKVIAYANNFDTAMPTIETTTTEPTTEEIKTEVQTTKTTTTQIQPTTTITTTSPVKGYIKINEWKKDIVKDDSSYYYLNHGLNGVKDGIGVPFVDFRQNFKTKKTIIYGHSFINKEGPFQFLQNYHNNKDFYNTHRYIEVEYEGVLRTYEIFSVYVSLANNDDDEGLEYFRVNNYTHEEWNNRLNIYKNNSEYDTGVDVNEFDKILILQTCSMDNNYREKYYRYNQLIMAKLIKTNSLI